MDQSQPWTRDAIASLEHAWQACVSEPEDFEATVRAHLTDLMASICRNIPSVDVHPNAKALRSWERVKQMLQFIHSNYQEDLTCAQIAGSANISESECLRCFRSTIGTTPIQYLREYRILEAARLLSSTGIPVAVVAAECGFQDVSYFTKTFREIMGRTPRAYRSSLNDGQTKQQNTTAETREETHGQDKENIYQGWDNMPYGGLVLRDSTGVSRGI